MQYYALEQKGVNNVRYSPQTVHILWYVDIGESFLHIYELFSFLLFFQAGTLRRWIACFWGSTSWKSCWSCMCGSRNFFKKAGTIWVTILNKKTTILLPTTTTHWCCCWYCYYYYYYHQHHLSCHTCLQLENTKCLIKLTLIYIMFIYIMFWIYECYTYGNL